MCGGGGGGGEYWCVYIASLYSHSFDNLLGALYKLKNLYELTNQYKHLYEVSVVLLVVDCLPSSECVCVLGSSYGGGGSLTSG